MQTVYACGGAGGGSQQREVADGADVVFTDTGAHSASSVYCVGPAMATIAAARNVCTVWEDEQK